VRDIKEFTEIVRSIAEETVPKTSTTPTQLMFPWLNDDCRRARKDRKQAQCRFNKRPIAENIALFKILWARALGSTKEARRQCWIRWVSGIKALTPLSKV
jgi:hypothetical protein